MRTRSPPGGIVLVVASVAVGVAILTGLMLLGSPAQQRRIRLDALRVDDLTAVQRMIASYAGVHKKLPPDLASLSHEPGYSVRTQDPESRGPYGYEIVGVDGYRICAIFSARSSDVASIEPFPSTTTWAHGVGRQCFRQHVDLH